MRYGLSYVRALRVFDATMNMVPFLVIYRVGNGNRLSPYFWGGGIRILTLAVQKLETRRDEFDMEMWGWNTRQLHETFDSSRHERSVTRGTVTLPRR